MTDLYPHIEPYDHGMLDVDNDNFLYWETCGNPDGRPAVVLHGGPGSGCTPWHRRLFDPSVYRVVLFDQRNCGRSTPNANDPATSLANNNTASQIADIERLRKRLGVERWLVLGGSWGSVLALAYAESHPERVTELVLFGVSTGRYKELDWLFRGGLSMFFPEQWQALLDGLPPGERGGDVVETYSRLLNASDPAVRERAATAWCLWESATPAWPPATGMAQRFQDPAFAYAFARIVTHYIRHNQWLADGQLLDAAGALAGIPGIMVNGRFDFQGPIGNAWALKEVWPGAELVVVDDAGHAATNAGIAGELVRATDHFGLRGHQPRS